MKLRCTEYQANKAVFDLSTPIDEVLLRFGQNFHQKLLEPESLQTYRNAVSNIDSHPEFTATYVKSGPEKTTTLLANYLDEKIKDGTIKLEISSHDTAIQLLLMFHGKAVYWRYLGVDIGESEQQRDKYLKSCVDMFLTHLRNK